MTAAPGRPELPDWLEPVRRAAEEITAEQLTRFVPPEGGDELFPAPADANHARGGHGREHMRDDARQLAADVIAERAEVTDDERTGMGNEETRPPGGDGIERCLGCDRCRNR